MPQAQRRPLFSTATANKARPLPKFQSAKTGARNSTAYLEQLDPLLKLNKGGFTAVGADASSNIPFAIPGAEPIAVAPPADQQPYATPYNQGGDTNPIQVQPLPNNPFSGTQQDVQPNIEQFMGHLDQVLQSEGYGTPTAPNRPAAPPVDNAKGIASMRDGGVLYDDNTVRYPDGTQRDYNGHQAELIPESFPDGFQHYTDGSVRKPAAPPQEQEAFGIQSMPGNIERYSDGSLRYGPYQMGPGTDMPGGTRGLITGIFGQDRTITQPFGNINPLEPTRGHVNTGTDLRTKDLTGEARNLKLPVGAKVVQVYHDDGTRFGDQSGHLGYGNSLLLELPSGERLRFSHLSKILDVKAGDTVNPGEVFGQPGTTGNTAGEHLDLEYYNPQGKISNPAAFSGFSNPKSILPNQPEPGSIVPMSMDKNMSSIYDKPTQQSQPNQSTQQNQQGAPQAPMSSQPNQSTYTPSPMYQAAQGAVGAVKQAIPQAGKAIAGAIDKVNPTGNFDLGVTETLSGNPQAAAEKQRSTIANVGTVLHAPELQTNELSQSQGTNPFRQLAGNLLDVASTPLKKIGVPDLGISEAIAGGKTVNTGANLAPQTEAYDAAGNPIASKNPSPSDYAHVLGDNINAVGQNVKRTFSNAVEKPIEGISKLKGEFQSGVADLGQGFNDALNKMTGKRKVGEDSGGDQNILGAPADSPQQNDIRDPFFKLGGAETYGKFLNKKAIGDGGLSLDLFTPDFYKDANNVANVFGSSYLLPKAQDKFKANEAAKYPKQGHMGYQDGYDNGAIDDYNKEIDKYNSSIDSYINGINLKTKTPTYGHAPQSDASIIPGTNFSPNVSFSEQKAFANPNLFSNSFSMAPFDLNAPPTAGGSATLSPTALNMSSLRLNSPSAPSRQQQGPGGNSPSAPSRSGPSAPSVSVAQARNIGSTQGVGVQRISTPSRTVSAPAGNSLRVDSHGSIQAVPKAQVTLPRTNTVLNFSTPVKTPSAQLANRPAPSQPARSNNNSSGNIFSRAVNAVKRLFGR